MSLFPVNEDTVEEKFEGTFNVVGIICEELGIIRFDELKLKDRQQAKTRQCRNKSDKMHQSKRQKERHGLELGLGSGLGSGLGLELGLEFEFELGLGLGLGTKRLDYAEVKVHERRALAISFTTSGRAG